MSRHIHVLDGKLVKNFDKYRTIIEKPSSTEAHSHPAVPQWKDWFSFTAISFGWVQPKIGCVKEGQRTYKIEGNGTYRHLVDRYNVTLSHQ